MDVKKINKKDSPIGFENRIVGILVGCGYRWTTLAFALADVGVGTMTYRARFQSSQCSCTRSVQVHAHAHDDDDNTRPEQVGIENLASE